MDTIATSFTPMLPYLHELYILFLSTLGSSCTLTQTVRIENSEGKAGNEELKK